jgi:outer membrane protein assembly factor BamB
MNGDLKWKYATGWGIDVTPAVKNGIVFVGSQDNNFYAFDAKKGEIKWSFNCLAGIHSSPIAYGEYVFFGSDDGRFYSLNQTTGDLIWEFAPGYNLTGDIYNYITTSILSAPSAGEGTIFIGAIGKIFALDAQTFEKPISPTLEKKVSFIWLIIIPLLILVVAASFYFYFSKEGK